MIEESIIEIADVTKHLVKEHPILFSDEMVRAIMEGAKTQTRRVIREDWWRCLDPEDEADRAKALLQCPYGQRGGRLWVREAFSWSHLIPKKRAYVSYRAACGTDFGQTPPDYPVAWKPSIHMPRWASRITLEVVDVRVERVQDIGEGDALAEGYPGEDVDPVTRPTAWYETLWNQINAKRGYGWETNPWVWVIEFRNVKGVKHDCVS